MSRRAPVVIGATVAGMFGLLSFHTRSTSGPEAPAGISGSANGASSSPGKLPGGSTRPSAGGSSTPTSSGSTRSSTGTGGSASASHSNGSSAPGAKPSGQTGPANVPPQTTTISGSVEQYGYGELAVSVSLSGSTITGISVPTLQTLEPTSQQIADEAIPLLRQEVLQAQSANISSISGATYTSQAYAQSVQSALDRAPR